MLKILIVEDEPIIMQDIIECLESIGHEVIGNAYNGKRALELLDHRNADLVLLDINLEGKIDGIEIANIINDQYKIPFIFLTSYADQSTLDRVKRTRPAGYIVKPFEERDLFAAVELAQVNRPVKERIELSLELIVNRYKNLLTLKECEILWNIYQAKTNKQMAEMHFVSINTIKTHIKKIYDKLDVHSRTEVLVKLRSS